PGLLREARPVALAACLLVEACRVERGSGPFPPLKLVGMPTPTLETERLILRPPRIEDAQPVFDSWAQDPLVTRYLTWRPHADVSETEEYISRFTGTDAGNYHYLWVMTAKNDCPVIGMIHINLDLDQADFGYVVARREWGKGLATEALRRVIEFGLSFPHVKRVWGVCDIDNPASARVMEKAGLALEGILPAFILHPNLSPRPRDVYCYALSRY